MTTDNLFDSVVDALAAVNALDGDHLLIRVREDRRRCRETGLPVYAVHVKVLGARRGFQAAEYLLLG